MSSAAEFTPLIGKQIAWKLIKGVCFRVTNCTVFSKVINDEVVGPPTPSPYALLTVEMLMDYGAGLTTDPYLMPVAHKLDFYNLWLMTERGILESDDHELMVIYKPVTGIKSLVSSVYPTLAFMVFPAGQFMSMPSPFDPGMEPLLFLYGNERKSNIEE